MSKGEAPIGGMTFEDLYRAWYRKMAVYAASFRRVPAAERDDLAHDILVHTWFRLAKYDAAFDRTTDGQESKSMPDVLAERSLVELVNARIDSMDDLDREIAMLVFYERLDSVETGRIVGKPAGTVRWRVSEIRKRLRKECGEYL